MLPIATRSIVLVCCLVVPRTHGAASGSMLVATKGHALATTGASAEPDARASAARPVDAHIAPFQRSSRDSSNSAPNTAHGDGGWIGGGLAYRVELVGDALRFVPALGAAVDEPAVLELRLARVARGTRVAWERDSSPQPAPIDMATIDAARSDAAAIETATIGCASNGIDAPHAGATCAAVTTPPLTSPTLRTHAFSAEIEQRVELTRAGVELSYAFENRPAGSGDLRVELACAFPLAHASRAADGGIDLFASTSAGVHVGAVQGIDARGARVRGELVLDGARLVLTLPASFVESAAMPFVLDPLLTPLPDASSGGADQALPDIAFAAPTENYLVVWERRMSLNQVDVIGQLIGLDGEPQAGTSLLPIRVAANAALRPSVGASDQSGVFAVAWQEGSSVFGPFDVKLREVRAADGALGNVFSLGAGEEPDVSSDPVGGQAAPGVFVALRGDDGIAVHGIDTPASLVASDFVSITAAGSAGAVGAPSLSTSGGAGSGTYVCVFERSVGGVQDVYGFAIQSLNAKPIANLTNSGNASLERAPVCDGDGQSFVLAYEREAATAGTSDVEARVISVGPNGALTAGAPTPVAAGVLHERDAAIVRLANEHWIAWSEQQAANPLAQRVLVTSIDPRDALACESPKALADASAFHGRPRLAARRVSGVASFALGVAAWSRKSFVAPAAGAVDLALLQDAGSVSDLGGACGSGQQASLVCAPTFGNAQFGHRLAGPAAGPKLCALLLGIATATPSMNCGGVACVLHVNPFASTSWFVVLSTSSNGAASFDTPIPATASGFAIREQWVIESTSAQCSLLGATLSNGLAYTLTAP